MADAYSLLVEASCQVSGLGNMVVDTADDTLNYLKGDELYMLLQPIKERIDGAMKLMGEEANA